MDRIKRYLNYIIIITFPIMSIVNIGENNKFNLALADIFILLLGIVWLIDIKNFKLKKHYPYFWYFLTLITVFLVSNVYNLNSDVVSGGISGIISEGIKFIISGVYLFVGYNTCNSKDSLKSILKAWMCGLWIFIIYGLYAQITVFLGIQPWTFNNVLGAHTRFLGSITDSNAAALYLSISFFLIIWTKNYLFSEKKFKMFLSVTNIFVFICILLTMSRGGIIGFFTGLGIYILYNVKYFTKKLYLIPLLLCIGLSIFYIDTHFLKNQFTNTFITRSQDVTDKEGMFDIRFNLSLAGINMGFNNPVIGVGRGNYGFNSKEYIIKSGGNWEENRFFYEGMVAHNTLAGMFAELGIIGLLTFISIFVLMFFKLLKSKYTNIDFKILLILMWVSIFVQSLSINLENSRVLWLILGICLIMLDENIEVHKKVDIPNIYSTLKLKIGFALMGLIISIMLFINIAPKYIYGDIDISGDTLQLDYKINDTGKHILRYYINTVKLDESKANTNIIIKNDDTDAIIEQLEYNTVSGYGNIYFDVANGTNLSFYFNGQDSTKIKDVKLIKPNKDIVMLLNNYPLLTKNAFKKNQSKGNLADLEKINYINKEYVNMDTLDDVKTTDLGGKIKYKSINITKLEDGNTQFEFVFECINKIEQNYIMWMHLGVDDINVLSDDWKPYSYINCDHSIDPPTNQWEVGKEYRHRYIVNLNEGEYNCGFGFWLPPENDKPEFRLYDKNGNAAINLGWFKIEQ